MTTGFGRDALEYLADVMRDGQVAQEHPQGGEFVIVPEGRQVVHLAPLDRPLTHVKARPVFQDTGSFCAFVNRFRGPATQIFADPAKRVIEAVFDYHRPPDAGTSDDAEATPAYGAFVARYPAPFAEEWLRWDRLAASGSVAQVDFLEFLEENHLDVSSPPAAEMLEIVEHFRATEEVVFESKKRLSDGQTVMVYRKETKSSSGARDQFTMPAELRIAVPVFLGGPPQPVRVLLRYRIREGRLVFALVIHRRELLLAERFGDLVEEIGEATEIDVLLGNPG